MGVGERPPWAPIYTIPRVSGITPTILTCSLNVDPSFSTCEKTTSCEKPGNGVGGHEVLKEPPRPGTQGSFDNCEFRSRAQ